MRATRHGNPLGIGGPATGCPKDKRSPAGVAFALRRSMRPGRWGGYGLAVGQSVESPPATEFGACPLAAPLSRQRCGQTGPGGKQRPGVGSSGPRYTGGPDDEEARLQGLRILEALKRLRERDREACRKLMSGEDVEPRPPGRLDARCLTPTSARNSQVDTPSAWPVPSRVPETGLEPARPRAVPPRPGRLGTARVYQFRSPSFTRFTGDARLSACIKSCGHWRDGASSSRATCRVPQQPCCVQTPNIP